MHPKEPVGCLRDLGAFNKSVVMEGWKMYKFRKQKGKNKRVFLLKSPLFISVGYRMDLRIRITFGREYISIRRVRRSK